MGANSADALIKDWSGRSDEIEKVVYTELRTLDNVDAIRELVPIEMLDIDARLAN